jgi:hypothetical protein
MSSKHWNSGMARAGHGRMMLQMPMHCYRYSFWEEAISTGVAKGIDEFLSKQPHRKGYALDDTDRLRTSLTTLLFANTDRVLRQALGVHAHAYGQAASTEAGFDLGIVGRRLVIGEPSDELVFFYATMKAEAYERLLRIDVNGLFKELVRKRRETLSAMGSSRRIPRSEALMDLICAALPCTSDTFYMSTPAEIVARFVETRLARFMAAPVPDFN